jgi:hypothetical protein
MCGRVVKVQKGISGSHDLGGDVVLGCEGVLAHSQLINRLPVLTHLEGTYRTSKPAVYHNLIHFNPLHIYIMFLNIIVDFFILWS